MRPQVPLTGTICLALTACMLPQPQVVDGLGSGRVDLGAVPHDEISEASGLVASRRNRDVLWTHNDAGHPNRLYALSSSNVYLGAYDVDGCPAGDWEDIAAGPGPVAGIDYLYIANIGDNRARREERVVCRLPEPAVDATQSLVRGSLGGTETITFQYPDGPRDSETLLVDPLTCDIYVVSKREARVGVYRAEYPQSTTRTQTLERVASLPLRYVVGGDISRDGRALLLKTYTGVFLWFRDPDQRWEAALTAPPTSLPYRIQIAGEAIAWSADGAGYFTLGENTFGIAGRLYFYTSTQLSPRSGQRSVQHRGGRSCGKTPSLSFDGSQCNGKRCEHLARNRQTAGKQESAARIPVSINHRTGALATRPHARM